MGDIAYIGSINFAETGECKVEVYGPNEGSIPHFHIYNADHTFECCVRIYDNHFFSHGNKYRDTLNNRQCEELNNWLDKVNDKANIVPMTNWQAIAFMWEANNPDCLFPENKKCKIKPHYENMNSFRDAM